MNPYEVLIRPLITEKVTLAMAENNLYAFEVDRRANKYDIKAAVESIFKVKVEKVRVQKRRGKHKRVGKTIGKTKDWTRALVTLKEGNKIEGLQLA